MAWGRRVGGRSDGRGVPGAEISSARSGARGRIVVAMTERTSPDRPRLDVTVLDATGTKRIDAEVPADVDAERLALRLAELLGLPEPEPWWRTPPYRILVKRTGRYLSAYETLADAGVGDDSVLRLIPNISSG
jgi:hypothetical protein